MRRGSGLAGSNDTTAAPPGGGLSPATRQPAPWILYLALAATLLVAFGLRVTRLGQQELRGDEAFGYFFSQRSFAQIVDATLALQEPHPVASYFVQRPWVGLAGDSEFSLRFLGVAFGVLAVALIYRLGRRLGFAPGASILAAGLLAISPYAIWHSQDARMYAMSLALTLASVVVALEALAQRRWLWWSAYVAVSWLALQTHYFAVFVLLALNVYVLVVVLMRTTARRVALQWLTSQAVLALIYLPWLLLARDTLASYRGNGDSPAFTAMLQRALAVFAAGESLPAGLRTALAVLASALLLIGVVRLAQSGPEARRALLLLGLYLATPLLATWVSAWQRPIFNERYLVAAVPPFYLLAAAAVLGYGPATQEAATQTTRRSARFYGWLGAGLLVLLMLATSSSLLRHYTDSDYSKTRGWRTLAAALTRYSARWPVDQVRLAQNFPDPTLWYYYRGPVQHVVLPPAAHDLERAEQEVAALVADGVERVVIPLQPADWWDDAGLAQQALSQHYNLALQTTVAGWPVQIYQRPPQAAQTMNVQFANGLRLATAALAAPRLAPGDVLVVSLDWNGASAELNGSEKLTLQVLNPQGQVVAQTDQPFGAADLADPARTYGVLVPTDLTPGGYRLIVALYDASQINTPRLLTSTGADYVELAVFDF
jgi:4-amino-4-deoxy-L-arabinose transferase-like glycosyltransferase